MLRNPPRVLRSSAVEQRGYGQELERMGDQVAAALGPVGYHLHSGAAAAATTGGHQHAASGSAPQAAEPEPPAGTATASAQRGGPAQPVKRLVRFMAHMREDIPHFYRPLVVYAGFEALAWVCHCMLLSAGFACRTAVCRNGSGQPGGKRHYHYYTANMPRATAAGTGAAGCTPIVFLHGVGE